MKNIKFLADENIASSVVNQIKNSGFDILDLKKLKIRGLSDNEVILLANKEKRIILTHDSDFSNQNLLIKADLGIIIIKLKNVKSEYVLKYLMPLLESDSLLKAKTHLLILNENIVRIIEK